MFRLRRLLLSDAPADGGGGAPPPAAEIVANSDAVEGDAKEIVRLKRLAEEQAAGLSERDKRLKERETRIAQLEDENRTLKTPPPKPEPTPVPAPVAKKQKESFLSGWSFYG